MATAPECLNVICDICMIEFSSNARHRPKSLPCGHTLCHGCLDQHIRATITCSTFCCPFCMKPTRVPQSSDERPESPAGMFPINFVLADTIERMEYLQVANRKSQLEMEFAELTTACQLARRKMGEELADLDLSVARTKDEIHMAAEKLIGQLSAAVRDNEEVAMTKLLMSHETGRLNVQSNCKTIKKSENYIKANEHLLSSRSLAESEIVNVRKEIKILKKAVEDYLATPRLGGQQIEIKFSKNVNTPDNFLPVVGKINLTEEQTDVLSCSGSRDEQTIPKVVVRNPTIDKLKLVKVINTEHTSDTLSPWLSAIDVVNVQDSIKIAVADNHNSCIKIYNDDDGDGGTLHGVCKTRGRPAGLTKLGDSNQVAVVLNNNMIVFVTVDDDVTVTKSVKTNTGYSRITQLLDSSLAVSVTGSNPGCVDILDLNCHVIRSITNLSPEPWFLTVSGDYFIVVSTRGKSVTCLTSSGHINWVKSRDTTGLEDPRGITCDTSGFVYVADFRRHSVVQMSASGDILRDVITRQDGLDKPRDVCFIRDRLYVTQHNGEIRIFTWE